jgi:hypothetical protein
MFGKCSRQVDHRLFILRSIKGQPFFLSQLDDALTKAGYIAVPEDTPNPFDKAALMAIAFNELASQEAGQSLASG